ncbi:MAG: transglutaminase N-terminal domain-containing protein [Alphaproteobacteria bacterium]
MFYTIRHVTRFRYSEPVRESVMELYLQPRSDGGQRLRSFKMQLQPHAQPFGYTDYLGNAVYHFDVPGAHEELTISTESTVEVEAGQSVPAAVPQDAWAALRESAARGDHWDMTHPSRFARPSPLLAEFEAGLAIDREADPLTALLALNARLYRSIAYDGSHTHVHSPIEDALRNRKGVCQDFAHIMTAIVRGWGVPCRYVSGYLFHGRADTHDRSDPSASHAWIETWLPDIGWIGFDPTNDAVVAERHIRVAVGRDYADVPPVHGTYKGQAESELAVAVTVTPTEKPVQHEVFLRIVRPMPPGSRDPADDIFQQQQQQQQ